jgi:hypothetical protein
MDFPEHCAVEGPAWAVSIPIGVFFSAMRYPLTKACCTESTSALNARMGLGAWWFSTGIKAHHMGLPVRSTRVSPQKILLPFHE